MSESNHSNSAVTKEDLIEVVNKAVDNLAGMVQQEFVSVNKRLDSLEANVADIKQTNRVLVGDVAEIKGTLEEQQHERRIHILELENVHKENRLRKVEQTVGLVK